MADEKDLQEPESPGAADQPSLDELVGTAVAKATAEIEEKYKANISGLHKRGAELEKELESEKTAHMNDKEKAEYDRERYEEDLTRREAVIKKAQSDAMITRGLADAGLPPEAREFVIAPTSDEETKAWAGKILAVMKAGIEKGVNEALLRNGGPAPRAGATITPMVDKGFDWAAWEGKPVAEKNAAWEQYLEAASAAQ